MPPRRATGSAARPMPTARRAGRRSSPHPNRASSAASAGRCGAISRRGRSPQPACRRRRRLPRLRRARRADVRDKTFLIADSAGINSPIGFGNPVRNSCVFCHNMMMMGNDVAPGQVDLGTTTQPFADPAPHLPLFRITCAGRPHPHYGRVILTSDPGYALTTGRCADVGKITLQSMRGLAARAPYFSNGSARDLRGVVDITIGATTSATASARSRIWST